MKRSGTVGATISIGLLAFGVLTIMRAGAPLGSRRRGGVAR